MLNIYGWHVSGWDSLRSYVPGICSPSLGGLVHVIVSRYMGICGAFLYVSILGGRYAGEIEWLE